MIALIARKLGRLKRDKSGNAALMVAISLPALVGGAGLAVDTAQWYMWKQELQFAVDQAALAGAWARSDAATQSTYITRARQEFSSNVQKISGFATTPAVNLVNHNGGFANAVSVTASATQRLPFSNLVTGQAVTVRADSRASFSVGSNHEGCLVSLHPSASGAFTLGGNASGDATCGVVALSTSGTAMRKNGNSDAQFGTLVAGGGIDSGLASNGTLKPNTAGLGDPFADVATPQPSSSTARTYSCPTASAGSPGTTATTATIKTRTLVQDIKYSGDKQNSQTTVVNTTTISDNTPSPWPTGQTVANGSTNGDQIPFPATSTVPGSVTSTGSGKNKIYYRTDRVTSVYRTYSNVAASTTGAVPANDGIARPQPGTYGAINISCETRFAPGIYVVNSIDFGQNKVVTGTDVMFVVKTSNGMKINSNSNITLSGITQSTLETTYGYDPDEAQKLASMIFFDRDSTEQIKINGNADVTLNGIIYTPKRELWFNGNSSVSGNCMMLVSSLITFTGTVDLNSFCQPSGSEVPQVGGGNATVKLIS